MARSIMIQGTASNAGKSVIAAGLCRIFRQDGFSVAPFKSQNMALNSFITADGLEMGRAQVTQAEAAGVEPSVLMNPILLKPTGEAVSQVIVNGEVAGVMPAGEYFRRKAEFVPLVRDAYQTLAARHDIVVIEGAGSPAEINLKHNDIVNMGMAAIADAPVLLVGDIDRGGVFASLYGTVALLDDDERARVRGLVINKFRGDVDILRPGLAQLAELTSTPVLGVAPWTRLDIDDEDSLAERLDRPAHDKPLDVAVIRLPRIANFTDMNALARHPLFGVRYVDAARRLGQPDLVILPGSKNTMTDLAWLRQSGLEAAIKQRVSGGTPLIGICGGFQMLGTRIDDPEAVEAGGTLRGMELLPVRTVFAAGKTRTRVRGTVNEVDGFFAPLSGAGFDGYEIHMGHCRGGTDCRPFATVTSQTGVTADGAVAGRVLGSYVHGLFDNGSLADRLGALLLAAKGATAPAAPENTPLSHGDYKETQYDILADTLRGALDMRRIYDIVFA